MEGGRWKGLGGSGDVARRTRHPRFAVASSANGTCEEAHAPCACVIEA